MKIDECVYEAEIIRERLLDNVSIKKGLSWTFTRRTVFALYFNSQRHPQNVRYVLLSSGTHVPTKVMAV